MTTKPFPGAVTINGVSYLNTTTDTLRRVDQLPAKDALIHEQVYRMIGFAQGLAAELARFKAHTFADVDALDAMLAQDYGVTRKSVKGNRTFTSADGRYRVSVKINTPDVIGPELQQAKALIDEIVLEKGADADPVLAALVAQVFNVGKQGRVNVDMLRRLRNTELDDPRWPRVRKAIDDAIKDGVSKAYITFHKWRDGTAGGWQMIPLDMAAVEITDDAFGHPSLRRQVEELTAAIAAQTGRIPDFPDLPPAAAVQHLVDWVLGLDPDADADDQAGDQPDDDPVHHVVLDVAVASRVYAMPVPQRLSFVYGTVKFLADVLDNVAITDIAEIASQSGQDTVMDATDTLRDLAIALGRVVDQMQPAQAAE